MIRNNLVLIGMPSSGKSTVGKALAALLELPFVDTDQVISSITGKSPKEIVNQDGLDSFLNIQQMAILSLKDNNSIISTGGSAIYSSESMLHLKANGTVVFLKTTLSEVKKRLAPGRRFAKNEDQSFDDIYNERLPLYEKYADFTIDCEEKSVDKIATEIISNLQQL